MEKRNLLVVTRQAGSVAAFAPLLPTLQEQGWSYDILASDASVATWGKLGFPVKGEADAARHNLSSYHLILTGTSLKVAEDAAFWKQGEVLGIPTFAFVESWVNYAERFTIQTAFDAIPRFIGVVDDLMARRMIEEGAPVERLKVVGHPRFSTLYQKFQAQQIDRKSAVKNILIYTDPVLVGEPEVKKKAGYDSKEVVSGLLAQLFTYSSDQINIVIKPHPREEPSFYQDIIAACKMNEVASVSSKDPIDLMLQADVVIGMNTILLIDSAMMGIPTYSLQPNRTIKRNDITDREGIELILKWEKGLIKSIVDELSGMDFFPRSTKKINDNMIPLIINQLCLQVEIKQ